MQQKDDFKKQEQRRIGKYRGGREKNGYLKEGDRPQERTTKGGESKGAFPWGDCEV